MSHPLRELQALLSDTRFASRGVVVSVAGSKAKVRTSSGIRSVQTNGLKLASGNEVYVSGNGVVSVVAPASSTTIYDV